MNMTAIPLYRHLAGIALALLLGAPAVALAQAAPSLGQAGAFSVLGGSAITNTGATVLSGDLGIWPGTASSITGFPPGIVVGTTHPGDAVALQAQSDLTTAFNDLAGRACNTDLTGTDLGGLTLTPGVYCFSTSAQLTGTLTLDAQGDPNAIFIFQIGTTLTTASNARVVLANGGNNCGVFWQVGSSATLGTGSNIAGNILALSSITVTTGASLSGRALARNGAVTLDTNNVAGCAGGCPTLSLAPATLPNGVLAAAYSQTVSASGGSVPYAYSLLSGALPTGLLLNGATGVISGTPIQAGSFTFTVGASDSMSCVGLRTYVIVINAPQCPLISATPLILPVMVLGLPYNQAIVGNGGTAPYQYVVSGGQLPAGISLNAQSGVLAGVPQALGDFNFAVTVSDALNCSVVINYQSRTATAFVPTLIPTLSLSALLGLIGAIGLLAIFFSVSLRRE